MSFPMACSITTASIPGQDVSSWVIMSSARVAQQPDATTGSSMRRGTARVMLADLLGASILPSQPEQDRGGQCRCHAEDEMADEGAEVGNQRVGAVRRAEAKGWRHPFIHYD